MPEARTISLDALIHLGKHGPRRDGIRYDLARIAKCAINELGELGPYHQVRLLNAQAGAPCRHGFEPGENKALFLEMRKYLFCC